jgi:1,2-phenylacetyl-CoA epoxidase catalytic subunit
MIQHSRAASLRERAAALRSLAEAIEATPAMSLEHAAGDDTWVGPRPTLCRNVLVANLAQLHHAADELRLHAWQLERHAEQLSVVDSCPRPDAD